MILIADSGSSKTDWRLIDDSNKIHQASTQGFNPYFQSADDLHAIINNELFPVFTQLDELFPVTVHFYGAGCRAEDKKQIVKTGFEYAFANATTEINTDMLGAARSLCGHYAGIAAILGTGSNTCFYNGKEITASTFSSGFILGDEGSGAHIGKTFIQKYLNDELPKEIAIRFLERYKLDKDIIIDNVYRKPMPNRYLASFSKFVYQNLKEQTMIDLVADCFEQFFNKHICKYPQHKEVKLSCTGSVAFYYSNILRAVATNKGVNIHTISETPIAGLTLFHLGE